MGAIGLGRDMSLINKQVLSEFLKYYLIVYRFIFGRKQNTFAFIINPHKIYSN